MTARREDRGRRGRIAVPLGDANGPARSGDKEDDVKLVTAIVKPHKLDEVKDALQELGVQGLTVSEVRGYGRQRGHTEVYRGAEYRVEFVPKVKLEILTSEAEVGEVIDTIVKHAQTGQVGDGKVWVTSVEKTVRIRTAEEGAEAL